MLEQGWQTETQAGYLNGAELEAKGEGGAEEVVLGVQADLRGGREANVGVDLLVEAEGSGGAVGGSVGDGDLGLDRGVSVDLVGAADRDRGVGWVGAVEANRGGEGNVRVVLVEAVEGEVGEEGTGAQGDDGVRGGVPDADVVRLGHPGVIELAGVGSADEDVFVGLDQDTGVGSRGQERGDTEGELCLLVGVLEADLALLASAGKVQRLHDDVEVERGVGDGAGEGDIGGEGAVVGDLELLDVEARAVRELGADLSGDLVVALGGDGGGVRDAVGGLGVDLHAVVGVITLVEGVIGLLGEVSELGGHDERSGVV